MNLQILNPTYGYNSTRNGNLYFLSFDANTQSILEIDTDNNTISVSNIPDLVFLSLGNASATYKAVITLESGTLIDSITFDPTTGYVSLQFNNQPLLYIRKFIDGVTTDISSILSSNIDDAETFYDIDSENIKVLIANYEFDGITTPQIQSLMSNPIFIQTFDGDILAKLLEYTIQYLNSRIIALQLLFNGKISITGATPNNQLLYTNVNFEINDLIRELTYLAGV